MKAILVDPSVPSVKEIQIDSWRDIAPALDCNLFTLARTKDRENDVYVDDEGLLKESPYLSVIQGWYPHPLAGKLLFLGADGMGDSCDCSLTVEDVEKLMLFINPKL